MTLDIRLVKLLTNTTLVGAVCRMFGANMYARIRVVHALDALGYVICLWRYAIPSFFFLLFFFPWNFNSSLLFLKFSIHQSTYYSIFCAWMSKILYMKLPYTSWNFQFISQHITKYFVHEYLKFYTRYYVQGMWKLLNFYCHINCFHYAWRQ